MSEKKKEILVTAVVLVFFFDLLRVLLNSGVVGLLIDFLVTIAFLAVVAIVTLVVMGRFNCKEED